MAEKTKEANVRREKRHLLSWLVLSEAKSSSFWRAALGEFLASFLFIVMAVGVNFEWVKPSNDHIALSTGLGVATLAHMFWDISGGQFNPAVAITMAVAGRMSVLKTCVYIIAQIGGCLLGSGFMYSITPSSLQGKFAAVYIHEELTLAQGFFMEFILTFQLIWTIMAATEPGSEMPRYIAPLAIGFCVAVGLYIGIPFTGAAMNPLRALGPAVVQNMWKDHWVYWVSPIGSGVITVLVYRYIFGRPVNTPATDKHEHPVNENELESIKA